MRDYGSSERTAINHSCTKPLCSCKWIREDDLERLYRAFSDSFHLVLDAIAQLTNDAAGDCLNENRSRLLSGKVRKCESEEINRSILLRNGGHLRFDNSSSHGHGWS